MPFTLTKSNGKLLLESSNGAAASTDLDNLNNICGRIAQEKGYIDRAESELADIAKSIVDGAKIDDELEKAQDVEHDLEENIKHVKKCPFTVYAIVQDGNWKRHPEPPDKICDVGIQTEDVPVSEEKADFKVDIDRTITVINQVLKPKGAGSKWMRDRTDDLSNYFDSLKGICHVGLEHEETSQLKLAVKSLGSFREEFVANEAGTVKNKYLWRLGRRCLLLSALASIGYVGAVVGAAWGWLPVDHTVYVFRNFFILAAGAGVGTWLSFSLRRVIVSFLDLAALEEDRLDPTIRILFVTALASIVGLLMWTHAVTLGFGSFTTDNFKTSGATALLIGLLLGVAERTMATAVQKRATEFGAGIGGK